MSSSEVRLAVLLSPCWARSLLTVRAAISSADRNANLFVALRDGFPSDLQRVAIETIESGLVYTWRDLERATAMLANLLDSLDLPASSRIAVQVEKSIESLLLYLAVLRA